MTPSRRNVPALPVPLLRDAIGRETARMSLRRAATAISISPHGLPNFPNRSAPRSPPSPEAAEIVGLVGALSTGVGSHDGVVLGRGIAGLLRDAYRERRGSVLRWVRELIVYYAREKRAR